MSTTTSAPLATVYCTDEHIAVYDPDDFSVLCPHQQCLARGADGAITAASPWTLTSATINFGTAGVSSGNVVQLTLKNVFLASGENFAVDTVSGKSITLRRIGQLTGIGQPPATTVDLSAIQFTIETLGPQIENESFSLNRDYSIDPTQIGRSPDAMTDLRDLREACVLQVLQDRYMYAMRMEQGDFKRKLAAVSQDISDSKARLQVRWAVTTSNLLPPPSTKFSTRLVR